MHIVQLALLAYRSDRNKDSLNSFFLKLKGNFSDLVTTNVFFSRIEDSEDQFYLQQQHTQFNPTSGVYDI